MITGLRYSFENILHSEYGDSVNLNTLKDLEYKLRNEQDHCALFNKHTFAYKIVELRIQEMHSNNELYADKNVELRWKWFKAGAKYK